jgi:hypothetical protein
VASPGRRTTLHGATMIFDLEPGIMDAPREAERRFWERV